MKRTHQRAALEPEITSEFAVATTGKPIHVLAPADLVTGAPVIGQPRARMRSSRQAQREAARERKRAQRARQDAGALVLPPLLLDEVLLDGLAGADFFIGRDRHDPEDVAAAILEGLWDVATWKDRR